MVRLQPGTPDSYAPLPDETDSAKIRLASAGAPGGGEESPLPKTPTTIASKTAQEVVSAAKLIGCRCCSAGFRFFSVLVLLHVFCLVNSDLPWFIVVD